MGIKLLILLALIIGVLFCIHLLIKDYQALTASKLLRLLFKRDLTPHHDKKVYVRWKRILRHDTVQCVRFMYCSLGAEPLQTDVQKGFVYMLTLSPNEEESSSMVEFKKAYEIGVTGINNKETKVCNKNYPRCPFTAPMLFEIVNFLLKHQIF